MNLIYPESKRTKADQNETKAQNIRRLASIERKKSDVIAEMIRDAKTRDPEYSRPWIVLMDGALHLWGLVSEQLKGMEYIGILDIIHVVEYLFVISNALYANQSQKINHWVYQHLVKILEGRVDLVIDELKQCIDKKRLSKTKTKSINDCIRYFENHRQWMKYDEYLNAGFLIGTGVVESSCGQTVKDRMEGSGRRWSLDGAEATLLLRSIYTSSDWDQYWDAHMKRERSLINQRMFDGLCSADDYDQYVDDLYLYELTGS